VRRPRSPQILKSAWFREQRFTTRLEWGMVLPDRIELSFLTSDRVKSMGYEMPEMTFVAFVWDKIL
jgi:hypothetical protein